MAKSKLRDTVIVHAGSHPEDHRGAVNPPLFHASTVLFPSVAAMEEAGRDPFAGVFYGRHGTPTTRALEEAAAALEGGAGACVVPSGLAAVASALMAFLGAGDHLLMADSVYAPSRRICDTSLARFGVETTYYDPLAGAGIADLIRPETKVVFVESPGSHTFEVQDVPAIAAAAHAAGAIVIMDNTWSGGLYFQPFAHGVDVSIQAATKYLSGHADVMLGLIICGERLLRKIKTAAVSMGYCAGPDDCYLALRGLRTISVRLARHQETGLKLARWFAARPEVARVLHPALESCPGHDIWTRDFTGASGLFGVVLNEFSGHQVAAMLDNMALFALGHSWGGYESLMICTDPAPLRTATRWEAPGPVLRIHAGLEDADDLIADLEAGFGRLGGA